MRLITASLGFLKVLIWSVQLNFTIEIDRRICRIVKIMDDNEMERLAITARDANSLGHDWDDGARWSDSR